MLVPFVMEDPNYDPDLHDDTHIMFHVPEHSRQLQALVDLCEQAGLECYTLDPVQHAKAKAKAARANGRTHNRQRH